MKKLLATIIIGIAALSTTWSSAETANVYDATAIDKVGVSSPGVGHMLTSVRDDGDYVLVTLTNVRVTPIGVDTRGENLTTPNEIALYSGIIDAAGDKRPFIVAKVVGGTVTFRIPNSAKRAGVPVVEHLWGRTADGSLALVHDPEDPFVVSEGGNLNTLAIGIVMFPNAPTASLKPYGKLDQGKHPEIR